ncbi:CcoQ/FixQ family Cbb3-type cytochrome c oxidase assembly chaperone [Thalassotalea psychrophila]|uniref:CcoQ/FixQ family Cbb3-type cytochrome c oxidase assembly chaperone n=1 Tax=Thalassotalea psychrophila TaxID=3065647 RepID=A0ABY9TZZ2_9GAMM|nr:CcoQ/FixQ family Cbb3-type cytochrome c oxidase assembly chaperone [Colwelliaceae bacterium SQ149]
MDIGLLRGIFTVLIFALFIIIVVWAYNKNRKSSFDEAANSIFDENENKNDKVNTNKGDN